MANFADALMLLGMGMSGNSQGISQYFEQQQEAKKQQQINDYLQGLAGGGNRTQTLGALAQLDPRTYAPMLIQETDPMREMDMSIKRMQIDNAKAEVEAQNRRLGRTTQPSWMPTRTPDFNPMASSPLAQYGDLISEGNRMAPQAQDMGVPVDNLGARGEAMGLPIDQIAQQAQQLAGQVPLMPQDNRQMMQQTGPARGNSFSPSPIAEAPQEQLPQVVAQNVVKQSPVIAEIDRQIMQERQIGGAEAARRIAELEDKRIEVMQNMQAQEADIAKEVLKKENENIPKQQAKEQFTKSLDKIESLLDELKQNGLVPTTEQGFGNVWDVLANTEGLEIYGTKVIPGGQTISSTLGTERGRLNQELKAAIQSLVGPYKAAAGRTGGEMNSEKELAAFMEGLPRLTNTYEANKAIVQSLRDLYAPNTAAAPKTTEINTSAGKVTIRRID